MLLSLIHILFGWRPRLHVSQAVDMTVEWTKAAAADEHPMSVTDRQIREFFG